MFDFIEELKKLNAKRIFIQYPEGLKLRIQEIDQELQKQGFETVICCEPTFGACDVRDFEAERLGCDAILHIGHSDFGVKSKIPVVYVDYFIDVDPLPILEKEFEKIEKYKTIGLFTSLQYVSAMKKVKEWLENKNKKIIFVKGEKYEGQILGCRIDFANKAADCMLYIGTGKFHPLGLALLTEKPVFSLDLEQKKIVNFEKEKMKYLKKKIWYEEKLKEAKTVCIVVCWKHGQNRIKEAFSLKRQLENNGKKVHILAFDTVSKEKILGFKFDSLVYMLCPRITDEDFLE
ncbi:MAG: diphthamide biosynthesis enzyme Dph2 [Candidatus Aenigmarchaeota archaeon]|nr:diphthamide biosynthesis enzyme Dph2 [Candidatus Aenigmarchaeota archaeon]